MRIQPFDKWRSKPHASIKSFDLIVYIDQVYHKNHEISILCYIGTKPLLLQIQYPKTNSWVCHLERKQVLLPLKSFILLCKIAFFFCFQLLSQQSLNLSNAIRQSWSLSLKQEKYPLLLISNKSVPLVIRVDYNCRL